MHPRRYAFNSKRYGRVIIGGSPRRLFRVTEAGERLVDRMIAGERMPRSTLIDRLLDAGVVYPIVEGGPTVYTAGDVTIVVPAYGPPGDIPDGAILVDDGSEPPVIGSNVRIEPNQGPAAARNAGLATVTTPLVAFVDTGVDPSGGWLERLVEHFDDPLVALVAPRVRSARRDDMLGRYERRNTSLDRGVRPGPIKPRSRIGYVPAAAILCRTDAIVGIGGFDESLRLGEDVDLLWRLNSAGWRCRYEPTVTAQHRPRSTWLGWVQQRIGYGTSAAPLARRHRGALAPLEANIWSVAAWLLVASGHRWTAAAIGAGTTVSLVRRLPDVPVRASVEMAAVANAKAGFGVAAAVRTVWWPLLALAACRSQLARRVLVVSALAARSPIRLADGLAYSIGVWRGMLTERTFDPLLPKISPWGSTRRRDGLGG